MSVKRGVAWTALLALAGCAGLAAFSQVEAGRIAAHFPPTGLFADVGASRMHYTERRPAGQARATVVLLHGASGNQADMMLPLGDRLAALGFRVIAPDRLGHGWSDRPGGEADAAPARQAAWIRRGLEAIGVRHAILVGHSWSGALATSFALDQPDFTDGLVLIAPVTHPWPGGIAWYFAPSASPIMGPLFNRTLPIPAGLALLDAGVRSVFAPQDPPPDYAERTGLFLLLRPADFMANAQDVLHLLDAVTTQAPRLGTIKAPTAIVTGDSDGIVLTDLHSRASAREIPGATLTVLPGVGHSPHWAAPDRVAAIIRAVADRAVSQGATLSNAAP